MLESVEQKSNEIQHEQAKDVYKYEVWEGVRSFYCRGKLSTGPGAAKNLLFVILLINVTNTLSFSFTWVDYTLDRISIFPMAFGVLMWILVNYLLFKASTTDPGLIPKQPDDEHTMQWGRSFKQYLVVDGMGGQKTHIMRQKFCFSCMIIRPKRSVHCR